MSKIISINNDKDFSLIYKNGKKWYCEGVIIFYMLGCEKKLAVVASKKVGNAVLRNRSKRLLRAVFDTLKNELLDGSYILVAKSDTPKLPFLKLSKNLRWGFKKLECLS